MLRINSAAEMPGIACEIADAFDDSDATDGDRPIETPSGIDEWTGGVFFRLISALQGGMSFASWTGTADPCGMDSVMLTLIPGSTCFK